ncbi:MAG: hypothetical protein ACHQ01_04770 [Candidatus Limnocylindrales bacterium]
MARAKRTDRAEARRKYRAYLLAKQEAEIGQAAGGADVAGAKPVSGREQRTQPNVQPVARMGIVAAARSAAKQPHYLDDIRNIRSLIFGSNAVWPIFVICVLAGGYIALRIDKNGNTSDPIVPYLAQFLFYPVPLLPPMVAGFLAPRATWLAGMIAGFMASMTLVVVLGVTALKFTSAGGIPTASESPSASASPIATVSAAPSQIAVASSAPSSSGSPAASPTSVPSGSPVASPSPAGAGSSSAGGTSASDLLATAIQLLSTSLAFGALMGALSGWYKRFLALTSGPRNKPPARGSKRPAQRSRPATR